MHLRHSVPASLHPIARFPVVCGLYGLDPFGLFHPDLKLRPGATHLKIRSADRFFETLSLDAIKADERIMLTYAWDGVPLKREHGFPLRIYIPDIYACAKYPMRLYILAPKIINLPNISKKNNLRLPSPIQQLLQLSDIQATLKTGSTNKRSPTKSCSSARQQANLADS